MTIGWRRLRDERDHRWARPRYSAYVDGDLTRRQQRRLHRHQGICPECRRMIASLRALLAALPSLQVCPGWDDPVADRTAEAVMRRIEAEEGSRGEH